MSLGVTVSNTDYLALKKKYEEARDAFLEAYEMLTEFAITDAEAIGESRPLPVCECDVSVDLTCDQCRFFILNEKYRDELEAKP